VLRAATTVVHSGEGDVACPFQHRKLRIAQMPEGSLTHPRDDRQYGIAQFGRRDTEARGRQRARDREVQVRRYSDDWTHAHPRQHTPETTPK